MKWMEALKVFNTERLEIDPTGKKWVIPKKDTPDYLTVKALMLKDVEEEATPVAKVVAKPVAKSVAKTVKPPGGAIAVAKTIKPVAKVVAKPVAKVVAKTVKPPGGAVAKPVAKTVKPVAKPAKPAKTVADYNRASMLAIRRKQKRDEDAFDKAFNEAFP